MAALGLSSISVCRSIREAHLHRPLTQVAPRAFAVFPPSSAHDNGAASRCREALMASGCRSGAQADGAARVGGGGRADGRRKTSGRLVLVYAGDGEAAEEGAAAAAGNAEAWWAAVKRGDVEAVKGMVADGWDVDARDESGRSALLFAVGLGREELATMLVAAGADINVSDAAGLTPLHMAAGYVQPAMVRMLLDKGADSSREDGQQRTPLKLAQELLASAPTNNAVQLGRCLALDAITAMLKGPSSATQPAEQQSEEVVVAADQ